MLLSAGDKLGPYRILKAAGTGGMGEVYQATDTRLNRTVAIKISAGQFSQRFEQEARSVAALNHPHICHLYDVGPNYLVMEFIDGAPIAGPLPLEKAIEYAGQILEALDAAHSKGITHRDLKPGNILVTRQGIKLLDFGLAKQRTPLAEADSTVTAALTTEGQIVGTLQYMSPEQLQGKEADTRSDLFSFGCVLYELLTGKRAFAAENAAGIVAAILERQPETASAPPAVQRVIARCLAKDPEQRFQTARDLKAALNWATEQAPLANASKALYRWWIALPIAVVLVSLGWIVGRFGVRAPEVRVLRLQVDPPERATFVSPTALTGGIAVAANGTAAAYVALVNGKTGLWVRPLDGTAARLLDGTVGAAHPFWSPDGKSIGFLADNTIKRVDLTGGAPAVVCEGVPMRGASWSNDGYILFGTSGAGLFRVAASGGIPSPLTKLDVAHGEFAHRWPQVLPGGRFLYWAGNNTSEGSAIYAASLAAPENRVKLVASDSNAVYVPDAGGRLLWLRGGTLVTQRFDAGKLQLFGEVEHIAESFRASPLLGQMGVAASATGLLLFRAFGAQAQFTWVDRNGKPIRSIGEAAEYQGRFRLAPDGKRIVVERNVAGGTQLWLVETERGVTSRFTAGASNATSPVWSPDGRTILFTRVGSGSIFRKNANAVEDEELLARRPGLPIPCDWSADGRWLLEEEFLSATRFDLWALPMMPSGKPEERTGLKPYSGRLSEERYGRFPTGPEPRWVAYVSDESGRNEVYVDAFPKPRGKKQISTAGGWAPSWGLGGRELYYVSADYKLMVAALKFGAESVEPSAPRELFAIPAATGGWYEAANEGQRFLVLMGQGQAPEPLTVIVNWPSLLKKPSSQ